MSKATRNRTRAAQERIAAQREAARRAERRRVLLISGGSIVGVIAIVVALVFIALNRTQAGSGHLPTSVASQITSVPATTLASVGTGALTPASSLPLKTITGPPLTSGGKPQMLYIGAELLPVLRGDALVDGGRARSLRHLRAVDRHPLVGPRRLPEHADADVLQAAVHQPVPDVHGDRERGHPQKSPAARR